MRHMSQSGGQRKPRIGERIADLWVHSRAKTAEKRDRIIATAKGFDPLEFSKMTAKSLADAPQAVRREYRRLGATGIITAFPILVVFLCLGVTTFFAYHSGFMDISTESDMPWQIKNEKSLNVNGSLDVYPSAVQRPCSTPTFPDE